MFQNVQKSCSQLIQRQGKISERLCLPQHSPFDQNCSVPSQKQPIHHRGRILCSFQTFGSESGTEPRFSCRQIINVFLIIVSDTDQMVFKPTMMQKILFWSVALIGSRYTNLMWNCESEILDFSLSKVAWWSISYFSCKIYPMKGSRVPRRIQKSSFGRSNLQKTGGGLNRQSTLQHILDMNVHSAIRSNSAMECAW